MEKKFITRIYRVAPSNGVNTISKVVKVVKTTVSADSALSLEEVQSFVVSKCRVYSLMSSGSYLFITSLQCSRMICTDFVDFR